MLTPDQVRIFDRLYQRWQSQAYADGLLLRYYNGKQEIEQLGMAIPPAMRRFLVVANWPRVVVDTIRSRQQVRSLILPGEETADPLLRAMWDASNMTAHVDMFNADRMIFGRAFMSVGSNEADPSMPLVRVESPREMAAEVDVRREAMVAAARFYGIDDTTGETPTSATLYLPDVTIWLGRSGGKWVEIDRDEHKMGAVPVVMHLNRRMSGGDWVGQSEMIDILPMTDAAARSLTNMQFAQEAHGIPRVYMTGVAQGDFTNDAGGMKTKLEAYFDAIHLLTKPEAKVGQLSASDLKNFETALNIYGRQASILTGFPARYFGHNTANPPAEGALIADESPMTRKIEMANDQIGVTIGWVGGLMMRFSTGEWITGNRVRVDWFDPATPTISQREDALSKRRAAGVLSREGYWDELGWTEPRKAKERAYLAAEGGDPLLQLAADLAGSGGSTPGN